MTAKSKVMDYPEFLERVIRAGLASILTHEAITSRPERLEGSRAGFEACRGKSPEELAELLKTTREECLSLRRNLPDGAAPRELGLYWRKRYFEVQVEHVANTVAARILVSDEPAWRSHYSKLFPRDLPTMRGADNAARVLRGLAGAT